MEVYLKNSVIKTDEVLYDGHDYLIYITGHKLTLHNKNTKNNKILKLNSVKYDFLNFSRISRRFFRTNKCNLIRVNQDYVCILRQYKIYLIDLKKHEIKKIFSTKNTRNVMSNSFNKFGNNGIIFGDYYSNPNNQDVHIYFTKNIFKEPLQSINIQKIIKCRHIHNIQYIPEIDSIFVTTGDYDGECWILEFDNNLNIKTIHGDGTQTFRTCGIHFHKGNIYWGMDSPLSPSKIIGYEYNNRKVFFSKNLPGPCWYSVNYYGKIVLSTADEPSSLALSAGFVVFDLESKDFDTIYYFQKDNWPYIFKYGTLSLKLSECMNSLWINFEAIKGKDGKSVKIQNGDFTDVY